MKKKVSLFLAIILSFFGMMSVEAKTATVTSIDAKAYYVDYGYADKGATLNTRKITLTDSESGSHSALCVAPTKKAPNVGDTSSNVVEINNDTLLKVLYYGEFGFADHNYAADTYWKSHGTNLINGQMILTHVAASKAYANAVGSDAYNWAYQANSLLISDTDAYINTVNKLQKPENYKVFAVKPTDNQKQVYVYLEKHEIPAGAVNLVKTSTKQTDKSLAGAVYKVYSDNALTNVVGTLTTDASGNTNTVSLKAGTYYVKEVKAPEGFKLNEEVYTANVTSGNTYTVHATDTPEEIIIKKTKLIVLKKGNGGEGTTLEGAEYTVYSDKELTKEIAVLITDDTGLTNYIEVDPGTYYIKETKAPKGYKLDETVHEVTVTDETIKQVDAYDEVDVPDEPDVPVTPVEPDLPDNPPTGVGDYMLASGGAAGFAGFGLYILKKKRYKLGI